MQEWQHIQGLLRIYEEALGRKLNRDKTTLFFSKATLEDVQASIINMLGIPEIKQFENYLGLPSFVGRSKKASLLYIKERVWSKIRRCKEKLLSQARREVLLKALV